MGMDEPRETIPEEPQGDNPEESSWQFDFSFSESVSWDDLNFKITFVEPVSDELKAEIESVVTKWATNGVDNGYGGKMHSWEIDEKAWKKKNTTFSFWADMGSSNDEKALEVIFQELDKTGKVKGVRLS
ncbi:MAG: hypothetical protein ACD_61C00296G0006 [uncultured bacterium]|nr:MAG: hypothetical protein ACD_61C00296G0006 [uncultured bacterium]